MTSVVIVIYLKDTVIDLMLESSMQKSFNQDRYVSQVIQTNFIKNKAKFIWGIIMKITS